MTSSRLDVTFRDVAGQYPVAQQAVGVINGLKNIGHLIADAFSAISLKHQRNNIEKEIKNLVKSTKVVSKKETITKEEFNDIIKTSKPLIKLATDKINELSKKHLELKNAHDAHKEKVQAHWNGLKTDVITFIPIWGTIHNRNIIKDKKEDKLILDECNSMANAYEELNQTLKENHGPLFQDRLFRHIKTTVEQRTFESFNVNEKGEKVEDNSEVAISINRQKFSKHLNQQSNRHDLLLSGHAKRNAFTHSKVDNSINQAKKEAIDQFNEAKGWEEVERMAQAVEAFTYEHPAMSGPSFYTNYRLKESDLDGSVPGQPTTFLRDEDQNKLGLDPLKVKVSLQNKVINSYKHFKLIPQFAHTKEKKLKNALSKAVNNKQKQNEVAQKRIEKVKQEQQVKQDEGLKTFLSTFSQLDKLQTYRL